MIEGEGGGRGGVKEEDDDEEYDDGEGDWVDLSVSTDTATGLVW